MFEKFSAEAGKKQFLIPYFIAAHPGTSDEDMMNLAIWLKKNGFRADQVQTFYPSPMATATAMYHTGRNPLKGVHRDERGEKVDVVRGEKRRRLHKAFLRYHDPTTGRCCARRSRAMGRADLIGNGKHHLIPTFQPGSPTCESCGIPGWRWRPGPGSGSPAGPSGESVGREEPGSAWRSPRHRRQNRFATPGHSSPRYPLRRQRPSGNR
jgi:hypothetical protein